MKSSVKAGAGVEIRSSFVVLTPDGAETTALIERKLFVVRDGKPNLVPFPGKSHEERTLEPGEHSDHVTLPTNSDMQGTELQFDFSVTAGGKTSTASANVKLM